MVEEEKGGMLTVKFLTRRQKSFCWPEHPDRQTVAATGILCRVKQPPRLQTDSSKYYVIDDYQHIDELCQRELNTI